MTGSTLVIAAGFHTRLALRRVRQIPELVDGWMFRGLLHVV